MRKIIVAVLVSALSVSGFAANRVIFSCTNKQGKKVEVKEIGENIQYSFGRPGNPELVFKNSKIQVAKQLQEYLPNYYYEQWLVLKNGEYIYIPGTFTNGKITNEGGVWVQQDDKTISSIICDNKEKRFIYKF